MIEKIDPTSVRPPSGPYSPGIAVGNLLFLAGRGPFDVNGERVGKTFAEQARATFEGLEQVANAAGTSLRNAVRVGVFVSSMDHVAELNAVMAEFVSEPYPVRTTVPVDLRGFDVEIDAVVYLPEHG